jgi:gamma-glutamylaminecyclotransferase
MHSVRLFVVGTLKKGFPLHSRGLEGATYLGHGVTVDPFPMVVAGPWYAPMILHEPGGGKRLKGELYEIDEPRLQSLDELESVGRPGNFRFAVAVEEASGGIVTAHAYFKARELAVPMHTGCLDDYQDRRFVPPESRGRSI